MLCVPALDEVSKDGLLKITRRPYSGFALIEERRLGRVPDGLDDNLKEKAQ